MIWFTHENHYQQIMNLFLYHFGRLTIKSLLPRKIVLISFQVISCLMEAELISYQMMHLIISSLYFPFTFKDYVWQITLQEFNISIFHKQTGFKQDLYFVKLFIMQAFGQFMEILNSRISSHKIRTQKTFLFFECVCVFLIHTRTSKMPAHL